MRRPCAAGVSRSWVAATTVDRHPAQHLERRASRRGRGTSRRRPSRPGTASPRAGPAPGGRWPGRRRRAPNSSRRVTRRPSARAAPPEPLEQRRDQLEEPQVQRQQPQPPDQLDRPGRATPVSTSPPAEVASRKTPTTRSPNSSGRCRASARMLIPPIECPASTTGPDGAVGVEHLAEVAAGAVDRGRRSAASSPTGRARAGPRAPAGPGRAAPPAAAPTRPAAR